MESVVPTKEESMVKRMGRKDCVPRKDESMDKRMGRKY